MINQLITYNNKDFYFNNKILDNEENQWKLGGFVEFESMSEQEAWNYFK